MLKNLSLIPKIMKIREKKMTTLCIGNCSTATRLQKIWTKSICLMLQCFGWLRHFFGKRYQKTDCTSFPQFFLGYNILFGENSWWNQTQPNLTFLWNRHVYLTFNTSGTVLVRDIKELIAFLFHSFFLTTTYFLGKIHGETKPNQIWPFSEIGMFI